MTTTSIIKTLLLTTIMTTTTTTEESSCDDYEQFCRDQQKSNGALNRTLCDNNGVTWNDNCGFVKSQCDAMSVGKILFVTGEGPCSPPIDSVGFVGPIGVVDDVNVTVGPVSNVDRIKANISLIPMDTVSKMDVVSAVEDVQEVDEVENVESVPKIPNKKPIIPTPGEPDKPANISELPPTLVPKSKSIQSLVGERKNSRKRT